MLRPMGREVGLESREKWIGSSSRHSVASLEDSLDVLTISAAESSCWTSICSLRNLLRNDAPHVASNERNNSCNLLQKIHFICQIQ